MNYNWNDINGQSSVKNILEKILNSLRVPHAFLFHGLNGVGKDFVAVQFARALNEKFLSSEDFSHIGKFISGFKEPYVKYIFPLPRGKNETDNSGPIEKLNKDEIQLLHDELDKKASNPYYKISLPKANFIKISSIREINKFISLNYDDVKYRVILISDAHRMNEEAQNALLKNLEEPPEGIIFILTTAYPGLLRETIRSRCWLLNFQPLFDPELCKVLAKYFKIDLVLAESVAPFAGGSVSNALKLIENDFEQLKNKTIFILRYSFGRKFHSALNEFSGYVSDNNNESIKLLIQMIIIWLNDLQKFRNNINRIYFKEHLETFEKFNKKFPLVELNDIVIKIDRLSSLIQNNVNLNLIILNIIFELSSLTGKI